MAENQSAQSLLENLSNLLASIENTNKPQTANIRLRGGYGFARIIGTVLLITGIVVFLGAIGVLVITMINLPLSTLPIQASIPLRILAATPAFGGMFSGLVLLGLAALIKTNIDTAEYSAQLLRLTKKRMEKR